MEDRIISYGGQAVIEGVLMRGQKALAIAMRAPDGNVVIHIERLSGLYRSWVAKVPFLRGMILLSDALVLGMRALGISANLQGDESEKLEGWQLYATFALSMVIGISVFMLLPTAAGGLTESWLGASHAWAIFVESVLRIGLLIAYIGWVGTMPEIKRVFMYHGAEHKTINAYEAGVELTPENVQKFPLEHPRCGTAFLLTVAMISFLLFLVIGDLPPIWKYSSRILLVPVIAGIAVEFLRWTANNIQNPIVYLLARPGLMLQKLTTREPELAMLEVSIASFNAMRAAEDAPAG
jgi:uncharacterized protein YqhQ